MFTTYILKARKDGKFYIGSTEDINKRLERHNKGYSPYTKNKGPFKIVYQEHYNTISEARKREFYLKSLKSRKALEKLTQGPFV